MKTIFAFLMIMGLAVPSFAQSVGLQMTCSNSQCNSTELTNASSNCLALNNKAACESRVIGNLCNWIGVDDGTNGGYCTAQPQTQSCVGYNCPNGQTLSVVKIRGLMNEDVNVTSDPESAPQNLGLVINNGAFPGKNANIAIESQFKTANGASLILIGDNFNALSINLDGYNGVSGESVAQICADRIKAGTYGQAIQTYFNTRRANNDGDPTRCDANDINYMQTNLFTCDDSGYTEISASNPVVTVSQIKTKTMCQASASYSICAIKKVQVSCNFQLYSSYKHVFLGGTTIQKSLQLFDEYVFNSEVSRLGSLDNFCNYYGRPLANDGDVPLESASGGPVVANWQEETRNNSNYTGYLTGSSAKSGYWASTGSTNAFTSPGFNPDGQTLAPGSNWQVMTSNTFEVCPVGWTEQKKIDGTITQYVDKENTSCTGVTDPTDPNNRAKWASFGQVQDVSFGTENVSCGIGTCPVNFTVSELSRSMDQITPQSGEDGTQQGRGLVFVYDIKTMDVHALPGGAGTLGAQDVTVIPQARYCAKIDDATAGIYTAQAKKPFVSFRKYTWQVIKGLAGGNPGAAPANTGKQVEVYKKLDPSARFLLDQTLMAE